MPKSKAKAKKRVRLVNERTVRNKSKRSSMRTHVKRVLVAVEQGDRELATKELSIAQKRIDKAAKARIIHPNAAARTKSQLAHKVSGLE